MRSRSVFLGIAAYLAATGVCVPAAGRTQEVDKVWDLIEFETKSWGRPISSWRLAPIGSGSWVESAQSSDNGRQGSELVFHEVEVGEQGYRQIADILARLPEPAPDSSVCANFLTDLPYGTLRLTRGATTIEIAWNSGCLDEDYAALLEPLRNANNLMGEWGKTGKVVRVEDGAW